ncbi:MAG: flagellar brake protein [Pseudomonadota bacterium]
MDTAEAPVVVRDVNFFVENAAMGQFVSVEIVGRNRDTFKTRLLGCRSGGYLILEIPGLLEAGNVRTQLIPGREVIVRTICEKTTGDCMGFYSSVIDVVRVPYPIVFIKFPTEVETRELRVEKRLPTWIPGALYMKEGESELAGTITDLSSGGCRFELHVDEAVVRIKAKSLYLRYTDPETGQETKRLCEVCSQRRLAGTQMSIGFSFMPEMRQTA